MVLESLNPQLCGSLELTSQRIDRTTRNREASKERNAKKKQAWEQLAAEKASDVAAEAIIE